MNFPRLTLIAVLSAALSACSNSAQTIPPTGTGANSAGKASSLDSWHRLLAQSGLPGPGCFKATYPVVQWHRIACSTPPRVWFPVPPSRRAMLAQEVGNGRDFTADTNPNLISTAIGAFPRVNGVKSVVSKGCCGIQGTNSYTLQLNSYFFPSPACGSIQDCRGWEQFVFDNPPGTMPASLFIQDWLVGTAGHSLSGCPPGKGWQYADGGCVQNSPYSVSIPNVTITDLKQMIETGTASSGGDSIYFSVDGTEYGMQNIQSDFTDLAANWGGAEFNVIGNAGGDIADFNTGSKITVSLQTDTGVRSAPTCPANSGTTGESNNLYFVPAPKTPAKLQYPSIEFTMNSKANGTPSCDTLRGT